VKTNIPSNFEDFDVKHFKTFENLIQEQTRSRLSARWL
jgi:hypothetical protein